MMDGFMLDDFGGDYSTGTPRQSLPAAGREFHAGGRENGWVFSSLGPQR